jgi:hypothetical protein
MIKYTTNTIA